MTIVRELITRLGFQVDKSGLDRFEKSIVGFKARFVLASAAITATVSKTLSYFREISAATQDTKGLADQAKIAVGEFAALRRTAEGFRIEPAQFDQGFSNLSKLLREAQTGYGELFEIIRKSRGELNLKEFVPEGDVRGAFVAIIDYVASLKDVRDQLATLSDIFGEDKAQGFLRIVNAGSEAFLKGAEANKAYGDSFAANIPKADEYLKTVNEFYQRLEAAHISFIENVLPSVTTALDFLGNQGPKGFSVLAEKKEQGGFLSAVDFLAEAITESLKRAVFGAFGGETTNDLQQRLDSENADFYRGVREQQQQLNNRAPVTVNSNVEVNLTSGTDSQAQEVGESVGRIIGRLWDEKIREVINNNPQAE